MKDKIEVKMDKEIRRLWNRYRRNYQNGGSLDAFLTFIEARVETMMLVKPEAA